MKSFRLPRHLVLALLAVCTLSLDAGVPAVKPQQLTSPDQVPKGLAKTDWSSIRAAYDAGRLAFQAIEGGWQARNPGQQWTATFDGRGFIARPKNANWSWGLELKSYGFGDQQTEVVGIPEVKADGMRLSYQWNDTLQEWFVNDSRGLEHGYTISRRPSVDEGRSSAVVPLSLTLSTVGTLRPNVSGDAQSVYFRDDSNATVLNYSGLKVWDADGKVLASRFEATGETHIRLLVEDGGARYPLTIDPIAQQAYLKSGNNGGPTDDIFGYSVAVAGDTVIVGARDEASSTTGINSTPNESASDSGAAYIFVRSGTTWSQQAYLKAGNSGEGDHFGNAVAISGDTVVVGAGSEDSSTTGVNSTPNENGVDSGAVYVFVRSGTVWSQQAYLKADNTGANDYFGFFSVAISGDTVVVGAAFEDSSTMGANSTPNENAVNSGAAYVFVRNGATWSQQAYLKASNSGYDDEFGRSVAVSGDTIVIGAAQERSSTTGVNSTPNDNALLSGAAYVFVRSGTAWSQQAYLKSSNSGVSDRFGISVAVSGQTVVVSAYAEDSSTTGVNSTPNESGIGSGAVYVFVRSGTAWSQQAYIKAGNTGAGDLFGYSVAISGETLVVGATMEDSSTNGVNGTPNESAYGSGAAYVFVRTGTTWSQQAYLKASNVGLDDFFGNSVAISGDTVMVGSYREDSNTTGVNGTPNEDASSAGAAYVYVRNGTAWSQQAFLKASNTPTGPGKGDFFGYSVAVSGDTVVVGAYAEDSSSLGVNSTPNENAADAGAAYVFVRSGTAWSQQAYLKASNSGASDWFGQSVAVSGDTVVVGACFEDSASVGVNSTPFRQSVDSGAAYVFVRSGTTWSQQGYFKSDQATQFDRFGSSVAASGDTIVVGAISEGSSTTGVNSTPNNNAFASGAAFVFVRNGTMWSQQAYLKASNTGGYDYFGQSVAISADTVVVGAGNEDSSTTGINSPPNESGIDSGAAYVFTRSGMTWSQQAYLKAGNTGAGDFFGNSVAVSGDTVVVGAYDEDSSTTGVNSNPNESASSAGAAYIFVRSGTVWSQQAYFKADNTGASDMFGQSVAVADDTVVVGAYREDSSTTAVNSFPTEDAADSGAVYIYSGSGPVIALPEIAIEQPLSLNLADGGERNFGSVALGANSSLTFTIKNVGAAELTGFAITKNGADPADFSVTVSPVAPVAGPSGSTFFTVQFLPLTLGTKTAIIHIASNDADENPYDITLTGTGTTAAVVFNNAITAITGLSGPDALPTAVPFGDGVENLLKYAFNMNLAGPDARSMIAGSGTAGLPVLTLVGTGAATEIRMEYLRRKGSGLIYTAKHSADLISFEPMSGIITVTSINDQWERVMVQEPCNPATTPKCFGVVEVELP